MSTLTRRLWYGAALSVGLSGLVVTPLYMQVRQALVLAVFTAVLGMAVVWSARGRPESPPPGLGLPAVGLLCGTTAVTAAGLTREMGPIALVLVAGVLITGWLVHRPRPAGELTATHTVEGPSATDAARDGLWCQQSDAGPLEVAVKPITELSTPELCLVWRRSFVALTSLARTSAERAAVVELRRSCLDELERRDPSGFARWVSTARAASDPGRFIPSQQQS